MKSLCRKSTTKTPLSGDVLRLQIESLEQRMLLTGDTYLVNFQFDEVGTPQGYVRDVGAIYGDRGNGLTFGWSSNHSDVSRARNANPDVRLDTLIHFHEGQIWEMAIPNGAYEATVAVGDPANNDGVHTIYVEGVNFWNALPDSNVALQKTLQVNVGDGRLTIDQGTAGEKATRINFVHVVGLPNGPNQSPAPPNITEPATDGQEVNPADVHMEAVGFSDPDGDSHLSSDWEIWSTGPGAERVWFTLGIGGVERLHTHLGDGYFENSHAGRSDLLPSADYELRARFRDDAGAVSAYASRLFHTEVASSTFSLQIKDVATSPPPAWESVLGTPIAFAGSNAILTPSAAIIAIDADGNSSFPGDESPPNAIDGGLAKYLNFGEINSGFIVTPTTPATIVKSFQITTANDAEERDPSFWQLYGTNQPIASADDSTGNAENWALIDAGSVALPAARNTLGPLVSVTNSTPFDSYRMLFTNVKNAGAADSMQFAEIQFFGDPPANPTPPSLRVESASGELLLAIEGKEDGGNLVTNPPALATHADVRLVISGGSAGLHLPMTNLVFTTDDAEQKRLYLPDVVLQAGESAILWVAADGSTYWGDLTQTEPDFTTLARLKDNAADVPFTPLQPGYVVEEVVGGLQLPTNIGFVPNPGPSPDDPYFYVTELYGTIRVVSRSGIVSNYATALLNFNPTGAFPGSGEQGLAGIVVDPLTGDVFATRVTATNPAIPNGAHHPQVLRFTSADGGRTASAMSVILDMPGENQGQSHQISNLTIGPDGKLYVHNGDGFDSNTAQNLDSYRGKILRLNLDGSPAVDNPFYDAANGVNARDYVFAYGVRNPFGGAWRASDGAHYEVENGPSVDRLAKISRGVNYNWNGSDASMLTRAIYNWNPAHGPVNITFIQQATFAGSQFPAEMQDLAFVSESGPTYAEGPQARGKRIVSFEIDASGNLVGGPTTLVEYTGSGRGSVVGLTTGPDGLYFTELYKDLDAASPIAAGARVFRVRFVGQTPGDYTQDDLADGNDFLQWQRTLGSTTDLSADGNRNRIVDQTDLRVWEAAFAAAPLVAAASVPSAPRPVATPRIVDAAYAGLATDGTLQASQPSDRRPTAPKRRATFHEEPGLPAREAGASPSPAASKRRLPLLRDSAATT